MGRKMPRQYRKPRYPRANSMRRMEGVLVDTARMGLMVGVTGAVVNTSMSLYGK